MTVAHPTRLAGQDGFSLVEVLMAALIAVVGLIGTFALIDGAQATTSTNTAREGAVALQREVVEGARSVPYEELTSTSLVGRVQQRPGLSDSALGDEGWTIERRGTVFTLSVGSCAVDDPRDGTGSHEAGVFCADPDGADAADCDALLSAGAGATLTGADGSVTAEAGSCGVDVNLDGAVDGLVSATATVCAATCGGLPTDTAPADYKRVVTLVRWTVGSRERYVLQSTSVANPGLAGAPAVIALTAPSAPVTSGTDVAFTAGTSMPAAAMSWSVDGTPAGDASGAAAAWSFSWPLGTVSTGTTPNAGEVLDGPYVIGAKAFDQHGQSGNGRSSTVTINRRVPYPVQRLEGGRNGSAVEFEWAAAKERDVKGYRVYRQPAIGSPVLVCSTTGRTRCRDTSPPSDPLVTYFAVALDADAAGATREGQASGPITVAATNTPPQPPPSVSATSVAGGTRVSWTASAGDPDLGDRISHYVIYRDGTSYAHRYDRTGTADELTFLDTSTGGESHTYWVAAVDTQLAESTKTGPVTR